MERSPTAPGSYTTGWQGAPGLCDGPEGAGKGACDRLTPRQICIGDYRRAKKALTSVGIHHQNRFRSETYARSPFGSGSEAPGGAWTGKIVKSLLGSFLCAILFSATPAHASPIRGRAIDFSNPTGGGLVTSLPSPDPTSDLGALAIKFDFNSDERSVGVFTNIGDGGIVSDPPIGHVAIVSTLDFNVEFGISALQRRAQSATSLIPEPSSMLLFTLGSLVVGGVFRRKKATT